MGGLREVEAGGTGRGLIRPIGGRRGGLWQDLGWRESSRSGGCQSEVERDGQRWRRDGTYLVLSFKRLLFCVEIGPDQLHRLPRIVKYQLINRVKPRPFLFISRIKEIDFLLGDGTSFRHSVKAKDSKGSWSCCFRWDKRQWAVMWTRPNLKGRRRRDREESQD